MLSLQVRFAAAVLLAAVTLVACDAEQQVEPDGGAVSVRDDVVEPDAEIELHQFAFRPEEVEVAVGETVEFANTDQTLHTVTSDGDSDGEANGGLFDEELDGRGERVQITFDEPGTYGFFCRPHNFMSGTVTVVP